MDDPYRPPAVNPVPEPAPEEASARDAGRLSLKGQEHAVRAVGALYQFVGLAGVLTAVGISVWNENPHLSPQKPGLVPISLTLGALYLATGVGLYCLRNWSRRVGIGLAVLPVLAQPCMGGIFLIISLLFLLNKRAARVCTAEHRQLMAETAHLTPRGKGLWWIVGGLLLLTMMVFFYILQAVGEA